MKIQYEIGDKVIAKYDGIDMPTQIINMGPDWVQVEVSDRIMNMMTVSPDDIQPAPVNFGVCIEGRIITPITVSTNDKKVPIILSLGVGVPEKFRQEGRRKIQSEFRKLINADRA